MWKQLITDLWKTCSFSYARSFSSQSVLIQLWLRTDPWLLAGWQWIYHIQQPELFLNVFCLFPVRMQPFLGCIDIFFVVLRALCPNLLSTSFVCSALSVLFMAFEHQIQCLTSSLYNWNAPTFWPLSPSSTRAQKSIIFKRPLMFSFITTSRSYGGG